MILKVCRGQKESQFARARDFMMTSPGTMSLTINGLIYRMTNRIFNMDLEVKELRWVRSEKLMAVEYMGVMRSVDENFEGLHSSEETEKKEP